MATQATTAGTKRDSGGGLWRLLASVLVFIWVLRSLIVAPFSIPSGSMLPTLYVGDYLLVAKWPYGYSRASFLFGFPPIDGRLLARLPERGDVVVFRGPEGNDVIKRVIGRPGDVVATRRGRLMINGRVASASEPFMARLPVSPNSPCRAVVPRVEHGRCQFAAVRETLPDGRSHVVLDQTQNPVVDDFGPVRVPADHVFVMGDNRDDSADSRISVDAGGMGFVPVDALVGRAMVTFWSTDGSANWFLPWTWISAARFERIGMRP